MVQAAEEMQLLPRGGASRSLSFPEFVVAVASSVARKKVVEADWFEFVDTFHLDGGAVYAGVVLESEEAMLYVLAYTRVVFTSAALLGTWLNVYGCLHASMPVRNYMSYHTHTYPLFSVSFPLSLSLSEPGTLTILTTQGARGRGRCWILAGCTPAPTRHLGDLCDLESRTTIYSRNHTHKISTYTCASIKLLLKTKRLLRVWWNCVLLFQCYNPFPIFASRSCWWRVLASISFVSMFSLRWFTWLCCPNVLATRASKCDVVFDSASGTTYSGCVPRISKLHIISSVWITSRPDSSVPYLVGVYVITIGKPSDPAGGSTPFAGCTVNSAGASAASDATNLDSCGNAFASLNDTLEDRPSSLEMVMTSSTSGSVDSTNTSYRNRPPLSLFTTNSSGDVNGRVGSNTKRYRTMTEFDFVQALLGPIASGTTVSDLSINGRRPSGTTWEKDGRKMVMERGSGGGEGGREGGGEYLVEILPVRAGVSGPDGSTKPLRASPSRTPEVHVVKRRVVLCGAFIDHLVDLVRVGSTDKGRRPRPILVDQLRHTCRVR